MNTDFEDILIKSYTNCIERIKGNTYNDYYINLRETSIYCGHILHNMQWRHQPHPPHVY